jgi:hypothetical protein
VVDHSEANGAFPSSILQSTGLQCSRRRLRWINEANAADQNKLIILNFASTRTFSNYNVERTTHGRIHYKFTHSMVENTVDVTSSREQRTSAVDQEIEHSALDFSCGLQEKRSRSKEHNNHGT